MTRCLTVDCQPANPSLVLSRPPCSVHIKEAWQGTWGPRQLSLSHKRNPDASFLSNIPSPVERCVYNHLRVCLSVITSNFSTLPLHTTHTFQAHHHAYQHPPDTVFLDSKHTFAANPHSNPLQNSPAFAHLHLHLRNITASMGRGGYN
jgi:hypothetical protein